MLASHRNAVYILYPFHVITLRTPILRKWRIRMEPYMQLLVALLFSFTLLAVLWLFSLIKNDAGFVDVGWTAGVGTLAIAYALTADGWPARQVLIALMGGLWSFRLVRYIIADRIIGKSEDGRYRQLRAHWGRRANFFFFFFFTSQAPLIVIFSIPFLVLVRNDNPALGPGEVAGMALWLIAIAGETLADRQLARFRKDPANRGKTCRSGLWRYSRHPNYFFEWLHWWSYVLMGINAPYGWVTLIGPVVMLFFLFFLTGIPHTE
ncbi:MAG: DUF1295 domain-containing protein, partial [Spirochaetales bacterium]